MGELDKQKKDKKLNQEINVDYPVCGCLGAIPQTLKILMIILGFLVIIYLLIHFI
jgi:hypothetical protein|tara:strand:- start:3199 stop:3363 length:165 start_codon:yes stop_codon:yes gene_type:complete